MTEKLKREKRRFLRELRHHLGKRSCGAARWVRALSKQMDAFINEQSVTVFDDVIAQFGTAEAIAQSMRTPESAAKLSKKARWIRLIIVIVSVLAAAYLGYWILSVIVDFCYYY